ncbi:hypothetical protein LZ31DRAFT_184956 [Colletotrichum somersetense]|nr:hypothetical protein LZ31DRAFT_184956 [Colletotrichum somersetense]
MGRAWFKRHGFPLPGRDGELCNLCPILPQEAPLRHSPPPLNRPSLYNRSPERCSGGRLGSEVAASVVPRKSVHRQSSHRDSRLLPLPPCLTRGTHPERVVHEKFHVELDRRRFSSRSLGSESTQREKKNKEHTQKYTTYSVAQQAAERNTKRPRRSDPKAKGKRVERERTCRTIKPVGLIGRWWDRRTRTLSHTHTSRGRYAVVSRFQGAERKGTKQSPEIQTRLAHGCRRHHPCAVLCCAVEPSAAASSSLSCWGVNQPPRRSE